MDKLVAVMFLLIFIRLIAMDLYFMNYHKSLSKLLMKMAKEVDKDSLRIRTISEFISKMTDQINKNTNEIKKIKEGDSDNDEKSC